MLVNVGRGKHVVAEDLIRALDSGQLSYAALDPLWPEPLPSDSPLWLHPKVTVMPHVARRPTAAQLVTEITANIRSLEAGGRLLRRARTFSDVPPGSALWYENANGLAEIAVNAGRADAALGLAIGSPVSVVR